MKTIEKMYFDYLIKTRIYFNSIGDKVNYEKVSLEIKSLKK